MTTEKLINKRNRGFTDDEYDSLFFKESSSRLIDLLKSDIPTERTAAAKILGRRKEGEAVPFLCEALVCERKLYPRIAFSEALGSIGEKAIPPLIQLLGKIGNNQYRTLPLKPFEKSNYPLPRDMAARTIIKIGAVSLENLEEVLLAGDIPQTAEAIDAVGYIAFYTGNKRSLPQLWKCLALYGEKNILRWKIIRAFQAYPVNDVIEYLKSTLKNEQESAIRWEAQRSLKQTQNLKKG